jgi:hypothetical protein
MTSTDLKSILLMNNRACLAMHRGKDEQSVIILLTQTLGRLKQLLKARLARPPLPIVPCNWEEDGDVSVADHDLPVQVRALPVLSSSRLRSNRYVSFSSIPAAKKVHPDQQSPPLADESTTTAHHIFDKAIVVVLQPCWGSDNSIENTISQDQIAITMYSACVVMNMAIAHHRWAVQRNELSSTSALNLTKAERLYRIVLKTLQGNRIADSPTATCGEAICVIAVNNLADVHTRLGRTVDANNDVVLLVHLLAHYRRRSIPIDSAGVSSTPYSSTLLLTQSDLNAMMLNILTWTGSPQLAPAA